MPEDLAVALVQGQFEAAQLFLSEDGDLAGQGLDDAKTDGIRGPDGNAAEHVGANLLFFHSEKGPRQEVPPRPGRQRSRRTTSDHAA